MSSMTKKLRRKRRSKAHPEQNFEYRIERLLRKAGFLTLNCASSRPYDIVAIKENVGIPIELKARRGEWSREQREFQKELASNSENGFLFLQQLHKRNKRGFMIDGISYVYNTGDDFFADTVLEIYEALGDSLNSQKVRLL